ncbi:hypothetical protein [Virgisporangium aurantiacum]|uniref:Uncharacterized protein n=1 Tax=Virgisporangium aurantiacum TaxID=175570 RepID=A0A8J4E1A6_9ACTN|nr:hypothetical protein [Virgisporangium aurantiacum]GIJ57819.1 hypothetical protein Vau01_053350 [Virgisporangium aurantiacum]
MNDIKQTLLDVVPPLPAPPDRLAAIRGRAAARRRMTVTGTALAALASVVTIGTTIAVLTPADPGPFGAGPASSGTGPVSNRPGPPVPPPPHSDPPKDFPMPGPGTCPPAVAFRRLPLVEAFVGGRLPEISAVTLCRYSQTTFDLSEGGNALIAGPDVADVTTFRNALVTTTQPYPPWASSDGPPWASGSAPSVPTASPSGSCSPGPVAPPPWQIDVVFVHSPDGTARALILHRHKCVPAVADPITAVLAAIDAKLGTPYR